MIVLLPLENFDIVVVTEEAPTTVILSPSLKPSLVKSKVLVTVLSVNTKLSVTILPIVSAARVKLRVDALASIVSLIVPTLRTLLAI